MLAAGIIVLATAGVIIRPFRLPEAIWALAGAAGLVLFGILPLGGALDGMRKGIDVYMFLTGMMLIAELARQEGLFDFLAAFAVEHARGSPQRLFLLVYLVGTLVTILLSNDRHCPDARCLRCHPRRRRKTAAVPARLRVHRECHELCPPDLQSRQPIRVRLRYAAPHRMVTPVRHAITGIDRGHVRRAARDPASRIECRDHRAPRDLKLSLEGRLTAYGIVTVGVVPIGASALDIPLGLPTFICGMVNVAAILLISRRSPWSVMKGASWSALPLVAGLFVMVEHSHALARLRN